MISPRGSGLTFSIPSLCWHRLDFAPVYMASVVSGRTLSGSNSHLTYRMQRQPRISIKKIRYYQQVYKVSDHQTTIQLVIYSECIIDDVDEEEKEEQEDGGCVCFWLCIILANNFIQIISPMTYPIKNHPIKNHHIPSYSHDISPLYHLFITMTYHHYDMTSPFYDMIHCS